MDGLFRYWLGDGRILGSEDPRVLGRAEKIVGPLVAEGGITHVLSLVEPAGDYSRFGVVHRVLPIRDLPDAAALAQGHAFMDLALATPGKVWIHCSRGMDRTGVMIGTWLVRAGADPRTVIEAFRSLFAPRIPPDRLDRLWADAIAIIRSFAGKPRPPCGRGGGLT